MPSDPDPWRTRARNQLEGAEARNSCAKTAADRTDSYRAICGRTWIARRWGRSSASRVGMWRRICGEARPPAPQSEPASEDGWTDEQFALEASIEERSRGFVGREELFATLAEPSSGNASSEGNAMSCLVGEPGPGKSAIFAIPHRTFGQNADVTLLAHAAGVDEGSVQGMLSRRCDELEGALGKVDQAAELI